MSLCIFSIVFDGEPFIEQHLPVFEKLTIPWRWLVAEGAAMNEACTAWCREQEPRLSRDGTTQYLTGIAKHPNVTVLRKQAWAGKLEQCNACLAKIKEPCVLIQADCDEFWEPEQLEQIHALFDEHPGIGRAYFACRYWVGPKIVVLPENDKVHNVWLRAWRFTPGDTFLTHEPPNLKQQAKGAALTQPETLKMGLVFDHFSYLYEHQVKFKQDFYGYPRAVEHWRKLQANKRWPAELRRFFPWAKAGAMATLVK